MCSQAPTDHERYEPIRVLGRGGAGEVYLVHDRLTGEHVALKRLIHADTQSLLRLKREFRTLADLHHPNLVKLYELGHDGTSAFFTMEYLEGEDLKDYLACDQSASNDNIGDHLPRVLTVFQQLANAVSALHQAGVLHRDLKPSNVIVVDGRVVLLDFGIAISLSASAATLTHDKGSSGTPAYMAPEQVLGEHIGEPNDWYAFGVMLYEALSSELPIEGSVGELLRRKISQDAYPIDQLVSDLPRDVSELCMTLLSRAPADRPTGDQVLRVLRGYTSRAPSRPATSTTTLSQSELEPSLFGREAELSKLRAVFQQVQTDRFAVAHVFGESGSGKSALVQSFVDDVATHATAPLVLRSRCYERESLPFKALDGVVDALVHRLQRENDVVVSHIFPRDIIALFQLFPSLSRLSAAQRLTAGLRPAPRGAPQTRAQAEQALRELLCRLASLQPVILWIDDLQWGDLDSIGILTSWLANPDLPQVMLVLSYRSEEIETSPCLTLLRQRGSADPQVETLLPISTLDDADISALCEQRLERGNVPRDAWTPIVSRVVREARGSPFLASQLAALAVAQPQSELETLTLEQLMRSRIQGLSPGALRLLNVLAVAGRPLPLTLALRAAGRELSASAALHELNHLQLIRSREQGSARLLEIYHDRMAETLRRMLSPDERQALDRALFAALQAEQQVDPEWLHTLARTLGEREAALEHGLVAAQHASETLAFERAAELYERCLELAPDPAADGGVLWEQLALAYSNAGHGTKSAAVYLHAAQHLTPERALEFKRFAASQLLSSGRFSEGEALVRELLSRLELSTPKSQAGTFAAIGWELGRIALRGLNYTSSPRSEIPFAITLYGMLAMETAAYDPLRAALFQTRHLRLALELGDDETVARALCAAATIACVSGSERAIRRANDLLARAENIASKYDSLRLNTNIASARAICAFLTSRFPEAIELCYQAEQLHRASSVDREYHHRFTIAAARIGSLTELGEYQRAATELQAYLQEAAATENISAELHITLAQTIAELNADQSDQAQKRLDRQRDHLPRHGFGVLHVLHMIAVLRTGSETGDYDRALASANPYWETFQHSVVRKSESFTMLANEAHARLLVNRCVRDGNTHQARKQITRHLRTLKGASRLDAHADATRLEARLALLQGNTTKAQQLLEQSSSNYAAHGVKDQVARNQWALGALLSTEQGRAMQQEALATLSNLSITNPTQNLRAYFPELLKPSP